MLFDGLITRQKVAEAKSKEELAAIDESALKDQVQLEVEQGKFLEALFRLFASICQVVSKVL